MSEVLSTQDSRLAIGSVQGVHKSYAGNRRGIGGVDLDLYPGEILGFVGANGSGKTTLLHILAGLATPTQGEVTLFGKNAIRHRDRELKSKIGFASQEPALDPEMKVDEILDLFSTIYGKKGQVKTDEIQKIVLEFGLGEFLSQPIAKMSGGQRQRVHLAILFLQKPTMLLLDEPTNALDPEGQQMLWQMLQTCRSENRSIVIATHQLKDAENHFDRVAIFSEGKIISIDTPQNLHTKHEGVLEKVFFDLQAQQSQRGDRGKRKGRPSWA